MMRYVLLCLLWFMLYGCSPHLTQPPTTIKQPLNNSHTYSEQGVGRSVQEAKDSALSNLTARFKAEVKTEFLQSKRLQGGVYEDNKEKKLQIVSELTLPSIRYSKAVRKRGAYYINAMINKRDIINFITNMQTSYTSLERYDNEQLPKIKKELENLIILATAINYSHIDEVVHFVDERINTINQQIIDAKLYVQIEPSDYKLYVDGKLQSISHNMIYVKPGTYTITIKKEGYITWTKRLSFKPKQSKRLQEFLLKDKIRYAAISVNRYRQLLQPLLKQYQVRIHNNAPYLLNYQLKKRYKSLGGSLYQIKLTLMVQITRQGELPDQIIETITDTYTYNSVKKEINKKKLQALMEKNLIKVLQFIDNLSR